MNGSADTSKADSIRQVAQGMSRPVRPRDVVAALKEQGITVSPAQVGQILKSMGLKRCRHGRKAAAMAGRSAASMGEMLTLDNLLAAKKLVNQLGSIDAAKQAVDALVKLS
jgi:arginine repressor